MTEPTAFTLHLEQAQDFESVHKGAAAEAASA